jgi:hypothetical protein
MGAVSSTYRPLDAHQPRGKQPWCDEYIHCGEPMSPSDPDQRSSLAPLSTQPRPMDLLGTYLRIRVPRCRCGFQMEKPR